jgi:hypothetical protein
MSRLLGVLLGFACTLACGAEMNAIPSRLRVGVVQMALGRTIGENRDRIVAGISNVAARGVRIAVFPEGALRGVGGDQPALVDQAVSAIQQAAREANLFVLFGGSKVYSPFSANLVVRAGTGPQLITATRHVGPMNRYHPASTSNFNPQMDAWYRLGAALIHPAQ